MQLISVQLTSLLQLISAIDTYFPLVAVDELGCGIYVDIYMTEDLPASARFGEAVAIGTLGAGGTRPAPVVIAGSPGRGFVPPPAPPVISRPTAKTDAGAGTLLADDAKSSGRASCGAVYIWVASA